MFKDARLLCSQVGSLPRGLPRWYSGKELSAKAGDSRNADSTPESGNGVGNGSPLQCLYLENPMAGGASRPAVLGVTMSQT